MKFSWSSESHMPADAALMRCAGPIGDFLQKRFASGTLKASPIELRYVPIIMPTDMHDHYKERSRIRIKQQLYDCAPHLFYDVFVNGSLEDQLREYVGGLAKSLPHLRRLGLSNDQLSEVEAAFADAAGGHFS
ncbi:hypothetical protein [Sphingobium aquiterrae]|uniref:hypothetical protein n=1 Tax=Sphingobium aquiterrae TaxID=2038656 RepID=UPI00301A89D9